MAELFSKKTIAFYCVIFLSCTTLKSYESVEELQRQFVELRYGAFFHFGIRTFTGGKWGEANQDISKFNPTNLDCNQWANALVDAKMKFGILTTKHHDGFCLWDSKYTDYDIASTTWRNGKGDVVKEYVEVFRAKNLEPCLYYSIWDNTAGIGNGPITEKDMEVIRGQLTELLSEYGKIKMLFIDGWSWKMGHKSVPYDEIHALVKNLQPECLLVDNTHLRALYHNDLLHFEDGSPCPEDNTSPSILSNLIYKNSGNGWFWDPRVPGAELMSVNEILDNLKFLEPRWCNYILNLPPNKQGQIDSAIVNRLKETAEYWSPDSSRIALPPQGPQIEMPITPRSASATSGNADFAIDGMNDRYYYSVWESTKSLPQSITIDLGKVYDDVSILSFVPKYKTIVVPMNEGSIKSFKLYSSLDSVNFSETLEDEWSGDSNLKTISFNPVKARYIKLEVLSATDDFAAATEIAIGRGIQKNKQ